MLHNNHDQHLEETDNVLEHAGNTSKTAWLGQEGTATAS